MAFCGINFSDDTKEERKAMNHTFREVLFFSTVKKQFTGVSKEGLLIRTKSGIKKDRRLEVDFSKDDFQKSSFTSLVQIKARLPSGDDAIGSGSHIKVSIEDFLLTCGHNLVSVSILGCVVKHKDGYVYKMRQGENEWKRLGRLDVKKIRVHPNFNGESYCGFDLAICPISWEKHENNGKVVLKKDYVNDSVWWFADPESLKSGMTVEVTGFPGEKDGHAFYHSGEIKHVVKKPNGGWILLYDVDATPGNSGSAIRITDEGWLNEHLPEIDKSRGIKKATIGIHTGHDSTLGLNFGTLLTPALRKWINGEV